MSFDEYSQMMDRLADAVLRISESLQLVVERLEALEKAVKRIDSGVI